MKKLKISKEFSYIGIADIIGGGIATGFWFYLAILISPEKYGEITYYVGIATLVAYIATLGTQNTIAVYAAKAVNIQSTLYFISLIAGAISSLILVIIFYRIDVSLLVLGYIINILAIGDLIGRKLFKNYLKYILIQKILVLVLGLGSYFVFGSDAIIIALGLTYVGFTVIIYKGLRKSKLDFKLLRSKFGFIFNNYIINAVGTLAQIDKLLIAPLFGFMILGNYNLATQAVSMMMIPSKVVFKYILAKDVEKVNIDRIKKTLIFVSIIITVIGIIVSPTAISIIFPKYNDAVQAIQIMILDVIPGTIIIIYTSEFLGIEKSRYLLTSTAIGLATSILGIIILGYQFGIIGLAATIVLSSYSQVAYMAYVKHYLNM